MSEELSVEQLVEVPEFGQFYSELLTAANAKTLDIDTEFQKILSRYAPKIQEALGGQLLGLAIEPEPMLAKMQRDNQKEALSERFPSSYKEKKSNAHNMSIELEVDASENTMNRRGMAGPKTAAHPDLMTGGLWQGTSIEWDESSNDATNKEKLSQKNKQANKNRHTLTFSFDNFKPAYQEKHKKELKNKIEHKPKISLTYSSRPELRPF